MTPKEILTKKPFKRIKPFINSGGVVNSGDNITPELSTNTYYSIPQEKFLAELTPTGHNINLKPDKVIKDKNGSILNYKSVAKIALPLQKVISTKQKIHLVTNQLKWTLTEQEQSEEKDIVFNQYKQGWIDKNMHVGLSKVVESYLETGDAAIYFYRNNGKLGFKNFSFKYDDILFPHYDNFGNLVVFGRLYQGFEDGKEISKLDVITEKEVVTYKKSGILGTSIGNSWKEVKNSRVKHGFSTIPICYIRSTDVCWGDVQDLIDYLEEAISNMAENNRYYANMILFLKGTIEDLPDRDQSGKVLIGKEGADAKFLASPESNAAQMNEINLLLQQIFLGSFTVAVSPDTVQSSGDLPGVTVKLLFSPAIEKALDTSKKIDDFIDKIVALFKEGYGIEVGKAAQFNTLKLRGEIDIYVPENTEEFTRMINDSLAYGSISKKTAAEKNKLGVNGEYDRIKEQESELLAGSLNPVIGAPAKQIEN